ncbi:MAG: carboxypeptidase-like regulatory domain-containing protein [bacterium]|nr:carboxypeptidase-like regulatory domain-containing protein [bacterium]
MGKIPVLLVLALITAALPAEDYATLSGVVCNESGMPIPYATIRVGGTDIHATSDEDGYFETLVPPGVYDVTCSAPGYVDFTLKDLLIIAGIRSTVHITLRRPPDDQVLTVEKPNIYLYPPQTTDVTVRLEMADGCALTRSDPTYGDGWNVTVEPDGYLSDSRGYIVGEVEGKEVIFDAPRYGYLFYEADAPDVWQRGRGWIITRDVLGDFFTSILGEYGFADREVDDFLEYWTPRLTESSFYAVYPQTDEIDAVVELRVEPEPDSVLRLFFLIEPLDETTATADWYLPEPVIPKFERQGFTVVEWGVCLADTLR